MVGGRVAGKVGFSSGGNANSGGRSYSGINEEIMYATIIMGIIIIVLIVLALCYIARENWEKRRNRQYYITA